MPMQMVSLRLRLGLGGFVGVGYVALWLNLSLPSLGWGCHTQLSLVG